MKLDVTFREVTEQFQVKLDEHSNHFAADLGEIYVVAEDVRSVYTGDYVITPKVAAQTMLTKDKVMSKDVTIKAIPFFNVSNTSGGSTVYIAKEM